MLQAFAEANDGADPKVDSMFNSLSDFAVCLQYLLHSQEPQSTGQQVGAEPGRGRVEVQ